MTTTVDKLNEFIAKLILLLEEELDDLRIDNKSKSATKVHKNITAALNKLVSLIIQINKLSKDEAMNKVNVDAIEDIEIIERFLQRHKDGK